MARQQMGFYLGHSKPPVENNKCQEYRNLGRNIGRLLTETNLLMEEFPLGFREGVLSFVSKHGPIKPDQRISL